VWPLVHDSCGLQPYQSASHLFSCITLRLPGSSWSIHYFKTANIALVVFVAQGCLAATRFHPIYYHPKLKLSQPYHTFRISIIQPYRSLHIVAVGVLLIHHPCCAFCCRLPSVSRLDRKQQPLRSQYLGPLSGVPRPLAFHESGGVSSILGISGGNATRAAFNLPTHLPHWHFLAGRLALASLNLVVRD
jgi:hypothetical protein